MHITSHHSLPLHPPSKMVSIAAVASSALEHDGPTASPPSSAHAIAGNDDALSEILLRTPVKSLIRFKSVSKHWSSLISNPHFSLLHTLRHSASKPSALLLRLTPPDFDFVPLRDSLSKSPSPPPFRSLNSILHRPSGSGTKILQSCNGLLLCCSFPHSIGNVRRYYVVNPTTKHRLLLDLPRADVSSVFGVNLAFDPSISPHYNVVFVRSTPLSIHCRQIEIYSSETRSWRLSGDSFRPQFDMLFTDGVFWNRAIHWISPSGVSLRFSVDGECLGTMPPLPLLDTDWYTRRYRFFGESNGHLHLIEVYGPQTTQFRVLEMERDYSQWFVKFSVNLDGIVAAFPEMVRSYLDTHDGNYYAFSILGVLREDNEDESFLVLSVPGKVISYNFKDSSLKKLLDFAPAKIDKNHILQFGCFDTYQYIESLAPV
ncbi:unnamed protein product [Camellia sinensis]